MQCWTVHSILSILLKYQEDDFNAKDAFILGGAMGWAYEEGLDEAERRKLEKKMQDDKTVRNRDSKT